MTHSTASKGSSTGSEHELPHEAVSRAFRELTSNLPYPSTLDKKAAKHLAQAVLNSLRHPTPKMIANAWQAIDREKKRRGIARLGQGPGFVEFWEALIDAALKEFK